MANEEENPPPAASKPPRRRRPTPTIDLEATEVSAEPKETSAAETRAAAAGGPSEPSPAADMSSTSSSESSKPPPTHPESQRRRKAAAASSPRERPAAEPSAGGEIHPKEPPVAAHGDAPPRPISWPLVGAATLGGLAVLALFAVLWLVGAFSQDGNTVATLSDRLARAEARLGDIATRPAPTSPDTKTVDALASRLAKLEESVAAAKPSASESANAGRLAAIDDAIKSLQGNVADLARRTDDNAAATREARGRAEAAVIAGEAARSAEGNNVEALGNRIAALEQAAKALSDEIAKRTASAAERPLRLAIAAQALRAAVERGAPFANELAAVKPLVSDAEKLTPLEAFAASGVPPASVLSRQLSELTPAMARLAEPPASGGFIDRLQANAERLVRIRPIDEAPGADPGAIISRIEAKAGRADIAGALTELGQLPAEVRAPAEDWIKQAQARNAALTAGWQIEKDAVATLRERSP